MPFAATSMNLEIIILSEINQSRRLIYNIAYVQNLKNMMQMTLFTKQKQTQNKFMVIRSERYGRGVDWEFGIDMYTLLYLKQVTIKDILDSPGNSAPYSVIISMGKEEIYTYVYN